MVLCLDNPASEVAMSVLPSNDVLQHKDYTSWSMSLASDEDRGLSRLDDLASRASFTRCCSASASEQMWLFFRTKAEFVRSELWNEMLV